MKYQENISLLWKEIQNPPTKKIARNTSMQANDRKDRDQLTIPIRSESKQINHLGE